MHRGFTLIELLIVVGIILILTAAAIAGSAGLIKNLRFGNTFNRMVFMVQRSRNLTLTRKGQVNYGVYFSFTTATNPTTLTLFADRDGSGNFDALAIPSESVDQLRLEPTEGITLFINNRTDSVTPCSNDATMLFQENGQVLFMCDAATVDDVALMEFGLQADGATKSFLIHRHAGIPQIM